MKTIAHWYTSIDDLSESEWNDIFHHETIKSFALFKAVELSKLDDVKHYYLRISLHDAALAIVPCFTYKLDLCVLMDRKTQKRVNKIRRWWKSFLYMDIFGVGSIIATCEQHFGIKPNIAAGLFDEVKMLINQEIRNRLKETKSSIIFIKEVPANELTQIKTILDGDFFFYHSLPNTFVPTGKEFRPYPQSLIHRSQKRYGKCVKEFDDLGLCWEVHRDFSSFTGKMYELYHEVYLRSKNKFDKLNQTFFEQVNRLLPENSYIALSRAPSGDIASMMLVIEEENKLVPLYLGVDYQFPDYRTVYFNTLFKTIAESERMDKDITVLGQTSYYPKILSGVVMQPLYLGFYSHKPVIKLAIRYLFKYLFPETKPPCSYRYKNESALKKWTQEHHLDIEGL